MTTGTSVDEDVRQQLAALAARLQELEDREAIRQLLYYKARATDRADPAAEARAFDTAPYADREGPEELLGGAEARAALIRTKLERTHHQLGNMIIDLRGDEAFTETYCTAFHRTHPTRESNEFILGRAHLDTLDGDEVAYDVVAGLRYLEHLRRTPDGWKIVARRLVYDWTVTGRADNIVEGGLYSNSDLRGARRPDDPSYRTYAIGHEDL
jgi:hypothetical protein